MAAQNLTPAQRRFLKQRAHPLKPLLQIGKEGVSKGFLAQLQEQLTAHELLKVRVLNNCEWTGQEIMEPLAAADVTVVQKVGHVFTLFKAKGENSQFSLPS